MLVDSKKINEILENAKTENLIDIPEGDALLNHIDERFTNHGVMMMFYTIKNALLNLEISAIKGEIEYVEADSKKGRESA